MAITIGRIKKWTKMLLGTSYSHVHQGEGSAYSKTELKGYYNDLTEKVTRYEGPADEIPVTTTEEGKKIHFSIEIFQYGLGAYDLHLRNTAPGMLQRVICCADWAVATQNEDGSWDTFSATHPQMPYSAMAQGEGISLLTRAYRATDDEKYCKAAAKALGFMLKNLEDGGTTGYTDGDVILYEYTKRPPVLNGWIFALWGILDYCKLFPNDREAAEALEATLASLKKKLPQYDNGYWSMYDIGERIASPFYHKLHIAQLRAMETVFDEPLFGFYAHRWEAYEKKNWNAVCAFVKKAAQKIMEKRT